MFKENFNQKEEAQDTQKEKQGEGEHRKYEEMDELESGESEEEEQQDDSENGYEYENYFREELKNLKKDLLFYLNILKKDPLFNKERILKAEDYYRLMLKIEADFGEYDVKAVVQEVREEIFKGLKANSKYMPMPEEKNNELAIEKKQSRVVINEEVGLEEKTEVQTKKAVKKNNEEISDVDLRTDIGNHKGYYGDLLSKEEEVAGDRELEFWKDKMRAAEADYRKNKHQDDAPERKRRLKKELSDASRHISKHEKAKRNGYDQSFKKAA